MKLYAQIESKITMLFAGLLPSDPSLPQILAYSGVGFLVVMFVLSIQSILTSLLGVVFRAIDKNKQ